MNVDEHPNGKGNWTMSNSKFIATHNKGFSITFANGNTVSVQWGPANYCNPEHPDGRNAPFNAPAEAQVWASSSAEVAAWDGDGNWHNFGHDQVDGWQDADEVLEFLQFAANNELNTSNSLSSDEDEDSTLVDEL